MATRLTLLCHAATPSMREGGFARADEAAEPRGLRALARHPLGRMRAEAIASSPARAALETVAALGAPALVEPALCDLDVGDWAGSSFAAVHARAPDALAAWIADPAAGVPGGESLAALTARVGGWLDAQAAADGAAAAVTHPMVIRALLMCALDLPAASVLRIDVAPLAMVVLSFNRGWRLQSIGG